MDNTIIVMAAIDAVGAIVGLISIWVILGTKAQLIGPAREGLNLFIWGVLLMIISFIYTLFFTRLALFPTPGGIDLHHAVMTVGMIFFVMAARILAKQNE